MVADDQTAPVEPSLDEHGAHGVQRRPVVERAAHGVGCGGVDQDAEAGVEQAGRLEVAEQPRGVRAPSVRRGEVDDFNRGDLAALHVAGRQELVDVGEQDLARAVAIAAAECDARFDRPVRRMCARRHRNRDGLREVPIGAAPLSACARALAPGGTYVVVGAPGPARFAAALVRSPFVRGRLRPLFSSPNADDLEALRGLLAAGRLLPVIDRRFSLGDVPDALRYVAGGHARGKVVITV